MLDSSKMKTGASSLNPFATSYVPLSKRGDADEKNDFTKAKTFENGSDTVWYGHQLDNASTHGHQLNESQGYVPNAGAFQTAEFSKLKDHPAGEFYGSSSYYANEIPEKSNFDYEFMDLAYLQINFPDVSEESLSDVYLANRCDLDAAVEMLTQLELYTDDSSHKLPDTLDIGDVPAPQNVKAEAGASTSS